MAKYTLQDEIARKKAAGIERNYGKMPPTAPKPSPSYSKPAAPSYGKPTPSYPPSNPSPSYSKPAPATPKPMSYGMTQEIQRKAANNIPLSSHTTQKDALYKGSIPPSTPKLGTSGSVNGAMPKVIGGITPGSITAQGMASASTNKGSIPPVIPKYNEMETTNYGTDALGNILYSKKKYDEGVLNKNSGLKGWAANNANEYYNQLTPEDAAKVKAMTTQDLIDFINNSKQSVESTSVDEQAPPVEEAPPEKTYEEMMAEYRAIAEAELAAEMAKYRSNADQQISGLRSEWDRSNQIQSEDRVMQDLYVDRNLSPFNGRTSYDKATIGRERVQADEAALNRFNQSIAGIEQGYSDAYSGGRAQLEGRANQMYEQAMASKRADAELALKTSDQTFKQGMDISKFGLEQDKFSLEKAKTLADLTGTLPNGQKTTAQQQKDLENLWKQADYTGTIPDVLAQLYGLPKGTKTQAAYEFAQRMLLGWDENARGWDSNKLGWDNNARGWDSNDLAWVNADAKLLQPESPKYDGLSPTTILNNIMSKYSEPVMQTDRLGKTTKVGTRMTTDPQKRDAMFYEVVDMHLPSSVQTRQILLSLGFSNQEINQKIQAHGGNAGN